MLPPGPRNYPLIGNPSALLHSLARTEQRARQYGDIVYYRRFFFGVCDLNRPEHIQDVLVTNNHKFIHGIGVQANQRFVGKGLLTDEGPSWRAQRTAMAPAFSRRGIARYAELMVSCTEGMLANWQIGQSVDLYTVMARLTLEIVARALFDADIAGEIDRVAAAVRALQLRNSRGSALVIAMKYLPTPRNLRYLLGTRSLEKLVYRLINQRRSCGEYGDDLLSALLHARDENGDPISDRRIRDESMTVIAAGYDTTALALSYTWYLLAQHPEVESKLVRELHDVLGTRAPGMEDLPRLPYLQNVIKESMRLYPPVPSFVRQSVEPVEIGGYEFPKGTNFIMRPWVVHRDGRFYDAPLEFRPERWTPEFEKRLPKFAYFPFGGGQRICIGGEFAKTEAALILATMAQKFHLTLAPGFQLELMPCINLQPKHGIQVVIDRRRGADVQTAAPASRVEARGASPAPAPATAGSRCPFSRLFAPAND
jgi:cytochrome P450